VSLGEWGLRWEHNLKMKCDFQMSQTACRSRCLVPVFNSRFLHAPQVTPLQPHTSTDHSRALASPQRGRGFSMSRPLPLRTACADHGVSSSQETEVLSLLKVLSMRGSQSSGARTLAERTLCGPQSSGKRPHASNLKRGSQSSGRRSRAGMTKTSTSALHETDREGCRQMFTCLVLLELAERAGLCRGLSSGPDGRMARRWKRDESLELLALLKRDESLDKVVVLFAVLVRRGLGGI